MIFWLEFVTCVFNFHLGIFWHVETAISKLLWGGPFDDEDVKSGVTDDYEVGLALTSLDAKQQWGGKNQTIIRLKRLCTLHALEFAFTSFLSKTRSSLTFQPVCKSTLVSSQKSYFRSSLLHKFSFSRFSNQNLSLKLRIGEFFDLLQPTFYSLERLDKSSLFCCLNFFLKGMKKIK